MAGRHGTVEERFERHYKRGLKNECWLWQGAKNVNGYGQLRIDGKTISAHRISYKIFHQLKLHRKHVLHKCDMRACVNPHHLFIGSHSINMKDRHTKGRSRGPKGVLNGNARLTPKQIKAIRLSTGTLAEIGSRFKIGISATWAIRKGLSWSHIPC